MAIVTDLLYRLRALTRTHQMDDELAAELEHHIATQAARYVAQGMSPDDARRLAVIDVRGIESVKERTRDVRGTHAWEIAMQDLRYAFRSLRRAPSFSIAAVVALGLGIGSTTAVFSMIDGVVIRALPYHEPDRLVSVWETNQAKGLDHQLMSPVNFVDYRSLHATFSDAAGWWRTQFVIDDDAGGDPMRVEGVEATSNFLDVFGVQPYLGKTFSGDSELRVIPNQVLISHRLWLTRYAGNPAEIGRTIHLNGSNYTVAGVLPAGFDYPHGVDLWEGLNWSLSQHSRGAHFWEGIARLAPGITAARANKDLVTLTGRLANDNKTTNTGWGARVIPLDREIAGSFRPALFALFGAAALLLVIACINVANLLLARGTTRQREIALRIAIGADRSRVMRLLLVESILLAIGGTIVGGLIAVAGVRGLLAWSPVAIPRATDIGVNGWVLGFAAIVALLAVAGFGLAPSIMSARQELSDALREGARGATSRSQRVRGTLVVAEVALAVILLSGAGIVMRSVAALLHEDLGVTPAGLVTAQVQLPDRRYGDYAQVDQFFQRLQAGLRARPEIVDAGAGYYLPLDVAYRLAFTIAGSAPNHAGEPTTAQFHSVDSRFFAVLGVRVDSGRAFTAIDDTTATSVAIVNEAFARQFLSGGPVIGRHIVTTVRQIGPLGARIAKGDDHEVVGVVANVKNTSLREPAEPAIYFSSRQFPYRSMHVVLRGRGSPSAVGAVLRDEVRRLDPALAVGEVRSMEQVLGAAIDPPRLLRMLLGTFAAFALALAAVGIYGILSFAVAQRRREMSVRIALGATPRRVLWMVVRQGLVLTLAGFAVGAVGAGVAGRAISAFLYRVTSWDPLTVGVVLAVLVVVAAGACFAPALRAAREDPAGALRAD